MHAALQLPEGVEGPLMPFVRKCSKSTLATQTHRTLSARAVDSSQDGGSEDSNAQDRASLRRERHRSLLWKARLAWAHQRDGRILPASQ
eukprot:2071012-Pleurochrysis_carterae.AAC.1